MEERYLKADGVTTAFTLDESYDEFGRLTQKSDGLGTTTFAYDSLNWETGASFYPTGQMSPTKTWSYSYTLDYRNQRRIVTETDPVAGTTVTYEDSKGRVSQVADPWGGTTTYRYDLDGEPLRTTFPNGAIEDRTYDGRGRITSIAELTGGGVPYDDFIYAYQGAGGGSTDRIASESSTLQGSRSEYYDSLGRLVGEILTAPSETIGYSYDPFGNRQTKTTNGVTDYYGYANERLSWMNEGTNAAPVPGQTAPYETFAYDADGRLSSRVRQYPGGLVRSYAFGWDEADRLTSVTDSGMASVFTASYDGEGLRQSKWDEWTGEHDYAWGSGGVVSDSSQSSTYVPGLGQKVSGVVDYFHTDQLGSVRDLSNASGMFPNGVGYDAYGNEVSESGGPWQPSSFLYGGGLGYQSEYASASEPGLGLEYLEQRYYDPATGRFISPDPIGIAGGLNPYAYVLDDPVNGADPSGLRDLTDADLARLHQVIGFGKASISGQSGLVPSGLTLAMINAAVRDIKGSIAAVPTGTSDPAALKAVFWAIDRLGDTAFGKPGTVSNGYTGTVGPDFNKCNIFVAEAYAFGGGIGWDGRFGVPTNRALPFFGSRWPYTANVLADPTANVPNFPFLTPRRIGDIIAFHSASGPGHSTLDLGGDILIYAGSAGVKLGSFDYNAISESGSVTYRRYRPGE